MFVNIFEDEEEERKEHTHGAGLGDWKRAAFELKANELDPPGQAVPQGMGANSTPPSTPARWEGVVR